jgi:hypothetical protein
MANQLGPKSPTAGSALLTVKNSASTSMSSVPTPTVPIPMVHEHTSVLTVDPSPTTHLLGLAGRDQYRHLPEINSFLSLTTPNFLFYRDFSTTIVHRDSIITADKDSLEQSNNFFLRIIHPYDTDAFAHFISKHDLTLYYSLLVTNLRNGFPLGVMPPLTDTVIFKNHPSTSLHSDVVDKYLTDELNAGRMSGPFSLQYVEKVLRGAVLCSPLLVSVQIQQPGMPDKLRVCRHLSKGDKSTPSMNSHINKEDFPTRFDTASKVADIVRFPIPGDTSISTFLTSTFMGFTSGGSFLLGLHLWWLTSTWASPLVALFYLGFTSGGSLLHGLHLWWLTSTWASPLVAHFYMGFTSGGSLLHGLHLWWLSSTWVSPLVAQIFTGFNSGDPNVAGFPSGDLALRLFF